MFAYCHNNPTISIDNNGAFTIVLVPNTTLPFMLEPEGVPEQVESQKEEENTNLLIKIIKTGMSITNALSIEGGVGLGMGGSIGSYVSGSAVVKVNYLHFSSKYGFGVKSEISLGANVGLDEAGLSKEVGGSTFHPYKRGTDCICDDISDPSISCPYTIKEVYEGTTLSGGISAYFFVGGSAQWSYDYKTVQKEIQEIWK